MSERLGDGTGARAKRRKEREDMSVGELEAEIKEAKNIRSRSRASRQGAYHSPWPSYA